MSLGLALILLLALLLGLAAVWLIWRARLPAAMARPMATLWSPFATLSGKAEARYRTPWMLLLGENGAGKSSVIASIPPWLEQGVNANQKAWAVAGAKLVYCNRGVLIDPDSGLPDAAAGSAGAAKWRAVLQRLRRLRPERPIDGLVLFVSAQTLAGDATQQQAESAWRQLCQVQDTFEFSLPVYVVVSRCDSLSGFSPFWLSQPPVYREELFGWSAPPASESGSPAQWASAAMLAVTQSLETLQLHVEGGAVTHSADGFFLFPRQLAALQGALSQWLEVAFRNSAWRAGFTCRGIYFTGSIEAAGQITPKPRNDVAFIDDLIHEKILNEPHLAAPTRQSIWSRDRLVRTLQLGGMAALAALTLGLAASVWLSWQQSRNLIHAMADLRHSAGQIPAGACAGKDEVMRLLVSTGQLSTTLAMPQAWLDQRVPEQVAQQINADVFQRVILPSLACHLDQRTQRLQQAGDALPASTAPHLYPSLPYQAALAQHTTATRLLEENIARYQAMALPDNAASARARAFALVASYAYGTPEAEFAAQRKGIFDRVLASIDRVPPLKQIIQARPVLVQQLSRLTVGSATELRTEAGSGASLLSNLQHNREPILDQTRHLAWWLGWARNSWVSLNSNPCLRNADLVQQQFAALQQLSAAYAALSPLASQFDATHCAAPAFATLDALSLAPYGQLFVQVDGARSLNPALGPELAGLNALLSQGFMQIDPTHAFSCRSPSVGWQEDGLAQANHFADEYQRFATQQHIAQLPGNASGQPLYARVALYQLEHALNSSMQDALSSDQLPASNAATADNADAELAQQSSSFARTLTPLLTLRDHYNQLGMSGSGNTLTQCVRRMASDRLGAVNALANDSQLYNPATALGQPAFFSPAGVPAINDYLSRQAARSQILTGYATPFVALLRNTASGTSTDPASNVQMLDYWANTLNETSRFTQARDRSGSMGLLDALLVNINGMTDQNCRALLQSNPLGASSNDLYFSRRNWVLSHAASRCSGYAQASAQDSWDDLARRFRTALAGRYPFGPLSSNDADPAVVRQFFTDYANNNLALRAAASALPGANAGNANAFLDQLDDWAAFFKTTLSAAGEMQPVHLVTTFRAQVAYSQGTEQLVSWALSSGARVAAYPNQPATLDWPYGQMLALDLNWADRSLWQPANDVNQADLQVQLRNASFAALGNWALLRFIDQHKPTSALPAGAAGKGVLLEFRVPVTTAPTPVQQSALRAYLGLLLQGIDPTSKALQNLSKPATAPYAAPEPVPAPVTMPGTPHKAGA